MFVFPEDSFPDETSYIRVVDSAPEIIFYARQWERTRVVHGEGAKPLCDKEAVPQGVKICNTPVEGDLVTVATAVATSEMKWLVHVAQKMDKKLKRVLHVPVDVCSCDATLIILEDRGDIAYTAEYVDMGPAFPATQAWECARSGRVVICCANVMERACPPVLCFPPGLVRPGSDGGKVTRTVIVRHVVLENCA